MDGVELAVLRDFFKAYEAFEKRMPDSDEAYTTREWEQLCQAKANSNIPTPYMAIPTSMPRLAWVP